MLHLDELVPKNNFDWQLDAALDFHFLNMAIEDYYGEEGQESNDLVVCFRNNLNVLVFKGLCNKCQSYRFIGLIDP